MNCKEGDLAVIVKSYAGNEGKIVKCEKFIGSIPSEFGLFTSNDYWQIDPPIPRALVAEGTVMAHLAPMPYCSDSVLRPLRGDLLDEDTRVDTNLPVTV